MPRAKVADNAFRTPPRIGANDHWCDGNDEVDFVLDHPTHPLAFEIGSSSSHPRVGLRRLAERHPRFRGRCWFSAPDVAPQRPQADGEPGAVPVDILLLALGRQAEAAQARNLGFTDGGPTIR